MALASPSTSLTSHGNAMSLTRGTVRADRVGMMGFASEAASMNTFGKPSKIEAVQGIRIFEQPVTSAVAQ
jgi:hypothetical protein